MIKIIKLKLRIVWYRFNYVTYKKLSAWFYKKMDLSNEGLKEYKAKYYEAIAYELEHRQFDD